MPFGYGQHFFRKHVSHNEFLFGWGDQACGAAKLWDCNVLTVKGSMMSIDDSKTR